VKILENTSGKVGCDVLNLPESGVNVKEGRNLKALREVLGA
jgi:hypothetical protein